MGAWAISGAHASQEGSAKESEPIGKGHLESQPTWQDSSLVAYWGKLLIRVFGVLWSRLCAQPQPRQHASLLRATFILLALARAITAACNNLLNSFFSPGADPVVLRMLESYSQQSSPA